MKSITSGIASTSAPRTKSKKKQPLLVATLSSTWDTQQPIYSTKKVGPTSASSSPEGAVPQGSIVNTTTESQRFRSQKPWIKRRTFLDEPGSVRSERIWKELGHSPRKPGQFMSVNFGYPTTTTESHNSTKYCWGILGCGGKSRTSIFYLIRAMLLSSTSIDAWPNSPSKQCLISPWTAMRSWLFGGLMRTPIPEWQRSKKKIKEECCWVPWIRSEKRKKKRTEERTWNKKGKKLWLQWWRILENNETIN